LIKSIKSSPLVRDSNINDTALTSGTDSDISIDSAVSSNDYDGRKPRTCGSFVNPLLVISFHILSGYSYYVLSMSSHLKFMRGWDGSELKFDAPDGVDISNWVFFWLIWLLVVWSLC